MAVKMKEVCFTNSAPTVNYLALRVGKFGNNSTIDESVIQRKIVVLPFSPSFQCVYCGDNVFVTKVHDQWKCLVQDAFKQA